MKRNLNLLALVLLLLSCQKNMVDKQGSTQIQSSAVKGSGSSQYTYLTVEVFDVAENSIEKRIKSDGVGLYVNGLNGVRAELQHSNGDFYMMTNTATSKPAKRFFKFPFDAALEGKNDYRIRIKDDVEITAIQNMDVGSSDPTMVMRLWSFDNMGNKLFDVIFNPNINEASGSDFVTVKRLDQNTWEVSPNGAMNAFVHIANSTSSPEHKPMPFKFILRKK